MINIVLYVLSQIWKSGANIYLDEKDGRIAIDKQNLIPVEVMQQAEDNFQAIDDWFKSWQGANAIDITIKAIFHLFCGWQRNETLNKWLCADIDSLLLFDEWLTTLSKNGFKDIYSDFRDYENESSNEMKKRLYDSAMAFKTKGGVN